MQKVKVALAAYNSANQKLPGTEITFEVEQEDIRTMGIPEGYDWPEETRYLGFWLIEYSEMLIKIVPPTREQAEEAGLLAEAVIAPPPEGGTTRVLRKGSSAAPAEGAEA